MHHVTTRMMIQDIEVSISKEEIALLEVLFKDHPITRIRKMLGLGGLIFRWKLSLSRGGKTYLQVADLEEIVLALGHILNLTQEELILRDQFRAIYKELR